MVNWKYYYKMLIIGTLICCAVLIGMIMYSLYSHMLFGTGDTVAEHVVNILIIVIPLILWGIMMLVFCKKGKKKHSDWRLSHTLMMIGTGLGCIGLGSCAAYVFVAVLEKVLHLN